MTVKNETPRHSDFYISTVTFLVEGSLFRVPREPFQRESEVFCDMFSLPQGSSVVVEGTSDESPIRIDRISKNDFEQLLKVLLHRLAYGSQPDLPHGIEQWTSVLKLSTTWNFERLRQAAIDALIESGIGAVDRVVLSQRYYIKNWLLPALNDLARRPEPITLEEANQMGIDIALKLASVRERVTVTMPAPATSPISSPQVFVGGGFHYSYNNNNNNNNNNSHCVSVGSRRDPRMKDCDFSDQIRSTFSAYEL
ncbi:hypothetical protein EDD15DRAFT_2166702 [Pisolithus albus]|nr:hypothetical protein EDD15DRAFT_2166702 [Pisolithus albus]